ncbi:hypothetical protein [Stackebrandtia soli]|uniref:hypothetical protein n=1 Tax=Stackebrandtia soli TaxID=1892856 RepID=UPI0039EC3FB5
MGKTTSRDTTRRALAWVLCAGMLLGLAWAGFGCMPKDAPARKLTAAEAKRLADVRVTNAEAGTVALAVQLPADAGGAHWAGHVDWGSPMLQAHVTSPDTDGALLQAIPGLVATRADVKADADPPRDGWVTRRTSGAESSPDNLATDIVTSAILSLTSPESADVTALRTRAMWLDEGVIDGAPVDAFRAPLLLGQVTSETEGSTDAQAEAVFWVDEDARLRRIQFNPGSQKLATIDFLLERSDDVTLTPTDVLGGAAIDPREVTTAEAERLSGLRHGNAGFSGVVSVEIPTADDQLTRATGYVDWAVPMAYIAVDAPGDDADGLRYATSTGVAARTGAVDDSPPEAMPTDGWAGRTWAAGAEAGDLDSIDLLLYRLVAMTTPAPDDPGAVAGGAAWLRDDRFGKADVTVYELRLPGDPEAKAGTAPFRYWVAEDDRLLRIEMRTGQLGLAHADLTYEKIPLIQAPYEVTALLI